MNSEPIVLEESFRAPVQSVWQALTDVRQMKKWYFEELQEFNPEVGFHTQFNVRNRDKDYLHMWTVTDVVPLKRIAYRWQYRGYTGDSTVVFELSDRERQTTLTLSVIGLDTFPQDNPDFTRESCTAGWNYFIRERLKAFLEV